MAALVLLAALAGGASAQSKKSAQPAQAGVFACLPKAERAKAERLLAACAPAYARAAKAAKDGLDPVFAEAARIVGLSARERLSAQGKSEDPKIGSETGDLAASLERDCAAARASLEGIAVPEEAKALAALLRSKASRNDPGAISKAEGAILACFPAKQKLALKELGARFKAGGAASHIAYIACVCESFLIDPAPFEKLAKGEAASLNDSAGAKAALSKIVSALSVQRALQKTPWHFAYPPSLTRAARGSGDEERRACVRAFFELAEEPESAWLASPWFMDGGIASWLAGCSVFLPILPDAMVKRLEGEAGRKLGDAPSAGETGAFMPDEADLRRALGSILDFETANSGTDAEELSRAAFAMLADRSARLLLGTSERYVAQRDACVAFLEARLGSLASVAYPGKAVSASAGFEGEELGAVLVIEDPDGKGNASFIGAEELEKGLKGKDVPKRDLPALGYLVGPDRLVSFLPLRFLGESEASAFAWRCLALGGNR